MIRLDSPISITNPGSADDCFQEIWDESQHSVNETKRQLEAVRALWKDRIHRYFAARGSPSIVGATPFARRGGTATCRAVGDLMFERYRSGNSTDQEIVQHARRVAMPYCPYCGLYLRRKPNNTSPDRDHVIPRSRYPEFSLLRVNILVVCDDCNNAKGAKDVDENGEWLFIHPYFDDFLAQGVLSVEIHIDGGAIVLSFSFSADLDEETLLRLTRHAKTLDIFSRYSDQPLVDSVRILEAHREYFVAGSVSTEQVRGNMAKQAAGILAERPNDPVGVILRGISTVAGLEQLLQQPSPAE